MQQIHIHELSDLAWILEQSGNVHEAEREYRHILNNCEMSYGFEHNTTAVAIHNLAQFYKRHGMYEAAELLYKEALAMLNANHTHSAIFSNNLALVFEHQKKINEAEILFVRALAINEKLLGNEHQDTLNVLRNLAGFYMDRGIYSLAEPLYEREIETSTKVFGPEHRNTVLSINNLARLRSNQNIVVDTEQLHYRALTFLEGSEHKDTAQYLNRIASDFFKIGKFDQAQALFIKALEIIERVLGSENLGITKYLNDLAEFYSYRLMFNDALPLYQRALHIIQKHSSTDDVQDYGNKYI